MFFQCMLFMNKSNAMLFVFAGFISFSLMVSNYALAYTIEYESIGYKLKQNPTICAIIPDDPDLSDKGIEKLLKQTKVAASEWEVQLQQAVHYEKNKEFWEINYLEIDLAKSDDASACTINVIFEKKPDRPVLENRLLGVAKLDPVSEIWNVTIYYLQTKLQYTTGYIGNEKFYWYEPYYGDQLRTSDELGTVIRHELGHALGLGHYQSDDFQVNAEWSKGTKPAPSIMVPIVSDSAREQKILAKDVDLMHTLYGENGFVADSDVDDFSPFKAKMFIEDDLYEEALSYTEKYLISTPDEEILLYKGEALWGLDRYSEAEKIVDEVLEMNPENVGALYIKGKALTRSDKYDEALDTFDELLKIDPTHDDALSYKGKIFYEQDMYQEAAQYYFESFDVNPFNVSNLNRIGILFKNVEKYEDAITFYDLALRVEPDRVSVLYNKGNALYYLERYVEALEYFDKSLEINPNHKKALDKKAKTLEAMGETDKAKEISDKLEKMESGNSNNSTPIIDEPKTTTKESKLIMQPKTSKSQIPDWVRGNAQWWAQGAIADSDFVSGIQYLIKEGIMQIPETTQVSPIDDSQEIPGWIKNNADWWANGLISDEDFVKGIQYLVEKGIVTV